MMRGLVMKNDGVVVKFECCLESPLMKQNFQSCETLLQPSCLVDLCLGECVLHYCRCLGALSYSVLLMYA